MLSFEMLICNTKDETLRLEASSPLLLRRELHHLFTRVLADEENGLDSGRLMTQNEEALLAFATARV